MVSDWVRRTTEFRSQVAEVWVIGRSVDRHTCTGEQDEFTPFLCVNHCLRQIYIGEAHSVPLRPILWERKAYRSWEVLVLYLKRPRRNSRQSHDPWLGASDTAT